VLIPPLRLSLVQMKTESLTPPCSGVIILPQIVHHLVSQFHRLVEPVWTPDDTRPMADVVVVGALVGAAARLPVGRYPKPIASPVGSRRATLSIVPRVVTTLWTRSLPTDSALNIFYFPCACGPRCNCLTKPFYFFVITTLVIMTIAVAFIGTLGKLILMNSISQTLSPG
jgi:hypothetical protein